MAQKRVTVDLITGFLGAGKTTFIHQYLHYLKEQGHNVRIIENEFGDVGIDSQLLKEDDCGDGDILDLSGLCMCCVGKTEFIQMLQTASACGCDRIIVEPSGIYDVDEFFEVLSLPQIRDACDIGSIITIADPCSIDQMTAEAKYLMFTQLLASGMVLLSKTQLLTDAEIAAACQKLDAVMQERGCEGGVLCDVCTKPWNQLTDDDLEEMEESGYARFVHDREEFQHAEVFQSVNVEGDFADAAAIEACIRAIFASQECGTIFRVKGFMTDMDGRGYEVNCTGEVMSVKETDICTRALAIIGQRVRTRGLKALGLRCGYI